jgi:hypothetical protein
LFGAAENIVVMNADVQVLYGHYQEPMLHKYFTFLNGQGFLNKEDWHLG